MPWTFAHPSAVLPLRRWTENRLSFCGLVVGSLAPDFGFYFGSYDVSGEAHTFRGLLTVCLPSGLAMLAIIRLLHRPVAAILPFPHRQRLLALESTRSFRSPSTLFWASLAVLLGALTHVLWDGFTHETGYFVLRWRFLRDIALRLGRKEVQWYELLQDLGSLLGAIIVVFAYHRWVRGGHRRLERPPWPHDRWRYQLLAVIVIATLAIAMPLAYHVYAAHGRKPVLFAVRVLVYGTTAFFTLLSLTALAAGRRASNG